MVVRCMPSPVSAQGARIDTLVSARKDSAGEVSGTRPVEFATAVTDRVNRVNADIQTCNLGGDLVVFIAKMTPIRVADLAPRDLAILNAKLAAKAAAASESGTDSSSALRSELDPMGEVFMALGRVFSGVLRRDSKLHVLGHRHDPLMALDDDEVTETRVTASMLTVTGLEGSVPAGLQSVTVVPENTFGMYICLGPSVYPVDEVPAGNIVGIIGLEDHVLKTATLSSTWMCRPMKAITFQAKPMVRVAVEPLSHKDLPKLESGLQSLYQYDPVVEVGIDDSGQHIMTCLGELHLELCLKTLAERFAK
jgi:ribosome assembly protein 1